MPPFLLEAGLTAALWDLFSHSGVPHAVDIMIAQLDSDDPRVQEFIRRRGVSGSGAWLPRRSPAADLALVTPDDDEGVADVLAFIEVKASALTNWPAAFTATKFPPLTGPTAEAILADYEGGSLSSSTSMCQADLYRSRQWWRPEDGVRVDNSENVLWLLFDSRGRTTERAFFGASGPQAWLPVDLHLFAEGLREYRRTTDLSEAHRDMIAVVLWHIDQSPGRASEVMLQPMRDETVPLSALALDADPDDIVDAADPVAGV